VLVSVGLVSFMSPAWAERLETITVTQSDQEHVVTVEGAVEAVKSSLVAPQVSEALLPCQ